MCSAAALAVAGEHHHADALLLHPGNGGGAGLLHRGRPRRSGPAAHRPPAKYMGVSPCPARASAFPARAEISTPFSSMSRRLPASTVTPGAAPPEYPGRTDFQTFVRLVGRYPAPCRLSSLDDSGCQRVLRHRLHRRRDGQQSLLRAAHGAKLRYGRLALCHGAGLIQHHRINGVRDLQISRRSESEYRASRQGRFPP